MKSCCLSEYPPCSWISKAMNINAHLLVWECLNINTEVNVNKINIKCYINAPKTYILTNKYFWSRPDIRDVDDFWKCVCFCPQQRGKSRMELTVEEPAVGTTNTEVRNSLPTFCSIFWQMQIAMWQFLHQLHMSYAGREVFPFEWFISTWRDAIDCW